MRCFLVDNIDAFSSIVLIVFIVFRRFSKAVDSRFVFILFFFFCVQFVGNHPHCNVSARSRMCVRVWGRRMAVWSSSVSACVATIIKRVIFYALVLNYVLHGSIVRFIFVQNRWKMFIASQMNFNGPTLTPCVRPCVCVCVCCYWINMAICVTDSLQHTSTCSHTYIVYKSGDEYGIKLLLLLLLLLLSRMKCNMQM